MCYSQVANNVANYDDPWRDKEMRETDEAVLDK